ncbi:YcnI family protein [Saccharopolyspora erythraea]|uniref:YcnI family copper-binding membrane protein n=1 Tax=Saccharopolyspora erythraea TaxID=1836 RepID=UPI001BA52A99|nr:YcnI family protein [Saccharopolyspora erythraea]QUG99458.1 YcnI family protein [Saccharopolyspora erythraea]
MSSKSVKRVLSRSAASAAVVGIVALASAGTASAHVSVNPDGEAAKGGHAKVAFRVPNERDGSGTVKIRVTLPLDHPLSSVRTKPMPGWTAQVEKVTLPQPVEVAGASVADAVSAITWTAQPGTRIAPDQFDEFEATLGTLPTDTDQLLLPTEQTYDNGEVVRWDAPTPPGGEEPEHPAPTLELVEDSEGGHGQHGQPGTGEQAEPAHAAQSAADDTARYLGGAGLGVGALALGIGIGALARGRKARS